MGDLTERDDILLSRFFFTGTFRKETHYVITPFRFITQCTYL